MNPIKQITKNKLRFRLFTSLTLGIVFFTAIVLFFSHVQSSEELDDTPILLRKNYSWNERIGKLIYSVTHLAPTRPAPAKGKRPRFNGDVGLNSPLEIGNYRLTVESAEKKLQLTIAEIESLPRSSAIVDFKCVEGWSEVIQYAGVRFTDFMQKYNVGKKADGSFFKYVGLETPDEEYYVSIDMESMQSPQTMLTYEMNQAALSSADGFPLRLIIPNKYGIKNIKRIGRIFFSDDRPPDYWAERGYDWYSGL